MNEEIKKKIIEECTTWSVEYMLKMMNEYEELVRKQAYLQGAKDMREAVKEEEMVVADFDGTNSTDISMRVGYNMAVRHINRKSQQFIDSLS